MWRNWFKTGPPRQIVLISVVTSFTGGVYLVRDSFRGEEFKKDVKCDGKVAVITGGNSGIGKETARELAKRGAIVYLLCRDKQKCDVARRSIVASTKNKYVYSRECDLASLESIKNFSDQFHKEETRLDILINNAGVWRAPRGKTKDGFETHLGVNHLGHFYLTNLLLDLLIKSAPSRIITVSSATHVKGEINKEDLNSDKQYKEIVAYNQSKLANILFTKELAERLKGTGVTANAVHPGIVTTPLYSKATTGISSSFVSYIAQPFLWIFFKTPFGGAQTTLYAALDPDLEKVTGKYFDNCKEAEVAPQAEDPYTAKWLWAVSEKWTRLKTSKPQTSIPQASAPQMNLTQTSIPMSNVPQTSIPQTSVPQTSVPQMNEAQTSVPMSDIPQASVSPSNIPHTNVIQTSVPQTNIPQTNVSQTSIPQTSTPHINVSQTSGPPSSILQTSMPQAS